MAGRARASCLPTSERPAGEEAGCSGAAPPTAHRSFPALNNGRNRSSPVPRASALTRAPLPPHVRRPGRAGPSLWPFPGGRGGADPAGARPSRDRDPPRSLAASPPMGPKGEELGSRGRQGWRRAGGGDTHRKRHCSWSCDSKKHRMPSYPPAIVAAATEQPGPLLGGWGRNVWAEGPAPHPGLQGPLRGGPMTRPHSHPDCWKSLVHPPCSCSWSPRCPFWAFSTQSSSDGTSSRKSACPHVGQTPTLGSRSLSGLPPPQP